MKVANFTNPESYEPTRENWEKMVHGRAGSNLSVSQVAPVAEIEPYR